MENAVVAEKLTNIEKTMAIVSSQLSSLVRLEEQHNNNSKGIERAFAEIGLHKEDMGVIEDRVQIIEVDMPALKELRRWVIAGLAVAMTMLLGSIVSASINNSRQQEFMHQLLLKQNQNPVASGGRANP